MSISVYFNRSWHAVLLDLGKKKKTSWLWYQIIILLIVGVPTQPFQLNPVLPCPALPVVSSSLRSVSDQLKCYYSKEEKKTTMVSLVSGLVGFLLMFLLCISVCFVFPVPGSIQTKAKRSKWDTACSYSDRMQGPSLSNRKRFLFASPVHNKPRNP